MIKKVYLIRSNDGNYKIGISVNPSKRIEQLNTGNPEKLMLIDTYESLNASLIETGLHNKYMYARQNGEWFDLSISEEVDFIKNCKIIDEAIKSLRLMGNIFV